MVSELSDSIARWSRHSAVRFLVVGGASLVVDTGSLIVFHGWLGIWLPLATTMAFGVAFVVNFGLNRLWAFGSAGAVGRQLTRYIYLVVANLGLTVVLVQSLTWAGLPYVAAKLVTAVILAIVNYVVSRKWIFI
jgi:putative flippase GtrA